MISKAGALLVAVWLTAWPADAQAAAVQAASPSAVTVFEHVAVVPMDRERVMRDQTVVVRGDRILALGPSARVRVPAEAVHVDGRGKYLIPGLADMHAHIPGLALLMQRGGQALATAEGRAEAERMLLLFVANGVTTIRVMGYTGDSALALRRQAARGELLSPRLYVAAGPVDNTGSPDSAVKFVIAAKAAGYDLLKLHGVNGATFDSAVAAARRVGLPVAGHVPDEGAQGIARALQAGFTSTEHLRGFPEYLADGQRIAGEEVNGWPAQLVVDRRRLRTIAETIRRSGTWTCPTQMLYEINTVSPDSLALWPEMRYVADTVIEQWRQSWRGGGMGDGKEFSPAAEAAARAVVGHRRQVIKALHDAGAGLLLGTDEAVPFLLPGFSVHRELTALVAAGLTPYEALAAGTRNVAAYWHTSDSTGTVAVGRRADLVLLSGNPLQDIRHTANPAGVMLGGRWLGRPELDRRLAALEHTLYEPSNSGR